MKNKITCGKPSAAIVLFGLLLSLCCTQVCFAQADSIKIKQQQKEYIKKAEQAQQQAMEQLKKMGIKLDPNKGLSKEDAEKLKTQLLQKAQQMKAELQAQTKQDKKVVHANINISAVPAQKQVLTIADRFYKRSYKQLDAIVKSRFDADLKEAERNKFSQVAVRVLANKGAGLITFGNDHNIACVYITAAVKAMPGDTLSINNFGAYLRIIDSVAVSLPVLLYANSLFSASPVILTQIGCSLLELNDDKKAEGFLKQALKFDPSFGQAHSALCEVYIRQHRLQEAIIELFAGVKGMGASYSNASNTFSYLQQQAENSDTKQDFWNETGKQVRPEDALAPLVPNDNRIKMPSFPNCTKHADWMEGGGYSAAVQAYTQFHQSLMSFVEEFAKIHSEMPAIPAHAVLRDYPNERFALDCLLEYFQKKSAEEAKDVYKKIDEAKKHMSQDADIYMQKHAEYVKEYVGCLKDCGSDQYCIKECERKYCSKECPAANEYNQKLQQSYDDYRTAFIKTKDNQEKILDDFFAFTDQWYSRIQGPYWSKLYAYEIRRVALSIIANCYVAYPQAFLFPAHNECGTDCSVYVNPYPEPPEQVEKKDPGGEECDEGSKHILHLFFCEAALTCEYWEVGCTAGVSASVRRNFGEHKSTTIFLGAGVEAGMGAVGGSAKFGGQVTISDDGHTDGGFRGSVSGTLTVPGPSESQVHVPGNGGYNGAESEFTLTIMGGLKTETIKTSTTGFGKEPGE